MKARVLKNNGNCQYSFHADFSNLNDAISYVLGLTNCNTPIIDRSNYCTKYDFFYYMIIIRNNEG